MVYVDWLRKCSPNANWRWGESCHLLADSVAELHEFAVRLGLHRAWFQDGHIPHYDLTRSKRVEAVRLGAKEIESRQEWLAVIRHEDNSVEGR